MGEMPCVTYIHSFTFIEGEGMERNYRNLQRTPKIFGAKPSDHRVNCHTSTLPCSTLLMHFLYYLGSMEEDICEMGINISNV